jgi:hypothetical protein
VWRRYRFTAAFLEQLLIGPWDANRPSSPHKLLNAYVYALADYQLSAGREDFAITEPEVPKVNLQGFAWNRVSKDTSPLNQTIYI